MINSKHVKNVEIDGISSFDYPDFCDAYCCYAEHLDGTPLTDEELEELTDTGFVGEYILDNQLYIND